MAPDEFVRMLGRHPNIFTSSIASGASWELIAEHKICEIIQQETGIVAVRQVRYPNSRETSDFAFAQGTLMHLFELKVESANTAGTFAGKSAAQAKMDDMEKLAKFDVDAFNEPSGEAVEMEIEGVSKIVIRTLQHEPFTVKKMFVMIAYSVNGREAVRTMMSDWVNVGDVTIGAIEVH
jgi:hypothetical protein